MADIPKILAPFEDEKFNKIYRFVFSTTVIVFLYLFCISFLPVTNQDNAKTILIFLLGWMSGNSSYLTGGNPLAKKNDPTVTNTGDAPVTNIIPKPENPVNLPG